MPLPQDEPIVTTAVEPLAEAIPGPAVHLRAAGVSLVLVARDDALPSVLHWGHDLGDLDAEELAALAVAGTPGTVPNDLDDPTPYGALLPEHSSGWNGRPGLAGSRSGRGWSPRFTLTGFQTTADPAGGGRVVATGADETAGLTVTIEVELLPSGLVRQRAAVTSTAGSERAGETYAVDGLVLTLPVPPVATELLDLTGRWGRERSPQRLPFVRGRALAGEPARAHRPRRAADPARPAPPGFGFAPRRGVGACTWRGAATTSPTPSGCPTACAVLGGGELLLPGEIALAAGRDATPARGCTPPTATGLDGARPRASTPTCAPGRSHPRRPRPVVLNTWEAVYFDHDLDRLTELADRGRRGRRRAVRARRRLVPAAAATTPPGSATGTSTTDVWPDGLHPLVDARARARHGVRALGRAGDGQPRLRPRPRPPRLGARRPAAGCRLPSRHQQVLDLGHPDAYAYLLERLDALLSEYPHRLPQVGPQPRPARRGPRPGRAAPACTRRPSPSTGCSTSCARRHPGRGDRVAARPAAAGSTSASWSAPTGSGPATATTRSSGSRSSAGPALLLPPELIGSHVGAAARAHHRPHPRPRLPGRHRAVRPLRHRVGPHGEPRTTERDGAGRVGGALQGRARAAAHRRRWSAPRSTTRRSPCTAWSPPTARTRCSRWCS